VKPSSAAPFPVDGAGAALEAAALGAGTALAGGAFAGARWPQPAAPWVHCARVSEGAASASKAARRA
jgi:hypothetical protein